MSYEQIIYETDGPVAVITLNRPDKLNAWTPKMSAEQADAIERANNDPAIGAIIMTGAGRGFCAGADINDTFNADLEAVSEGDGDHRPAAMASGVDWINLVRGAKPIIAAVNGVAVGIGSTMVLPCDIIIASTEARFGMFFVKMGLVPELASSHYLVQRVGFGKAHEMCLTGRLYSAPEALDMGLVNRMVEPETLLEEAKTLGREIAQNPSPQLRIIKRLLSENGCETDMAAVQAREGEALDICRSSPEHKEAVDAFIEKRAPNFRQFA